MMRGTVYTITDGVPAGRDVMTIDVDTTHEFSAAAHARVLDGSGVPPGTRLEFGPIGRRWPYTLSGVRER